MGVRLSHRKSAVTYKVTVSPQSVKTEYSLDEDDVKLPKLTSALTSSKGSLVSTSSSPARLNRRVSFDLLAELAYAMPEHPLSPILVEVEDGAEQEMGNICDGSSTSEDSGDEDRLEVIVEEASTKENVCFLF